MQSIFKAVKLHSLFVAELIKFEKHITFGRLYILDRRELVTLKSTMHQDSFNRKALKSVLECVATHFFSIIM